MATKWLGWVVNTVILLAGLAALLGAGAIPVLGSSALAPSSVALLAQDDADQGERPQWVEPEGVSQGARAAWRPGNFEVLPVVCEFLSGAYEVRPELRACAYPLFRGSGRIESPEAYNAELLRVEARDRAAGRSSTNKLRTYVLQFRHLELQTGRGCGIAAGRRRAQRATCDSRAAQTRTQVAQRPRGVGEGEDCVRVAAFGQG